MRKVLALSLLVFLLLSACQGKGLSTEITSADRIHLIYYGYAVTGGVEVEAIEATVTDSSDIKKIRNILENSTKSEGIYNDLMGTILYEIILEKYYKKGNFKKETYTVYQFTNERYDFIKSENKINFVYADKNRELSALMEKYLMIENPFETN
jgi:hypothetical protein